MAQSGKQTLKPAMCKTLVISGALKQRIARTASLMFFPCCVLPLSPASANPRLRRAVLCILNSPALR